MLEEWLPRDETALATRDSCLSWAELLRRIESRATELEHLRGKRVGLPLAPTAHGVVDLFACRKAGVHVFLMADDASEEQIAAFAKRFGFAAVSPSSEAAGLVHFDHAIRTGNVDAITILTSGTTGEPKAVEHTWASLTRPVRRTENEHPIWLLTYRPHLYAGLQVMMQCLLDQGCLVMPQNGDSADEVAELAAEFEVEFASATPSYWRWLLTFASSERLDKLRLRQITLGGEAVDQATLDALRSKFADTRLVHIYATTELGRCFSVTDGRAGFPIRFLDEPSPDGIEMQIDDGELVVRSANAMQRYDQGDATPEHAGWFKTGDLVQVDGDRVFFIGRKTEMINVGGNKVYPLEVEAVIRKVDGVADVRVYGEKSSILGELVKCDLVIVSEQRPSQESYIPSAVEAEVRKRCLAELTSFQIPRFISIVDSIPRTGAGKTDRN